MVMGSTCNSLRLPHFKIHESKVLNKVKIWKRLNHNREVLTQIWRGLDVKIGRIEYKVKKSWTQKAMDILKT